MAMPAFQVFKILVDTEKRFFSVFKQKAYEQVRNYWSSSPMVLSVVSVLVPSENRDVEASDSYTSNSSRTLV